MISPAIHRLQPQLDQHQQAVIAHTGGPLLVIAGPGAGKTRTIVWRAVNLLLLGAVSPEELVLCTFSKRAAHELRQRFTVAAQTAGCDGDLSAVRVATVHGLCRRILSEHGTGADLESEYRLLDEFAQLDLMNVHFHRIFGPDREALYRHGWRADEFALHQARRYFDRIAEEAIDLDVLTDAEDPFHAGVGRCCLRYQTLLDELGYLDLSRLQVKADELLLDDGVVQRVGAGVRHLLVDEYQDTSGVQERILLRLAEVHGNISVVGDDDQSLYRFRGASVRNLLEFTGRFPDAAVRRLTVNYRSHYGIVDSYDRWMASADWSNPEPEGMPFRRHKTIKPHNAGSHPDYPSVIAGAGQRPTGRGAATGRIVACLEIARGDHRLRPDGAAAAQREGQGLRPLPGCLRRRRRSLSPRARRIPPPAADFPTGRIAVTTIHQSKGLEWPVVAVGSLDGFGGGDEVGMDLEPHFPRPTFEPLDRIADFDRMRQHYVAFSRARDLLILTAAATPAAHFNPIWEGLPRWPDLDGAARDKLLKQRFGAQPPGDAPAPPRDLVIPRVKRLIVRQSASGTLRATPG